MHKTLDRGLNIQKEINCSHQSVLLHACFLSSSSIFHSVFCSLFLCIPHLCTPSSTSLFFVTLSFYYLHLFRFLMFCFSYILIIPNHVLTLDPDLFFSLMPTCLLILYSSCSYVLLFRYYPAIPLFSTSAVFLSRRLLISPYPYSAFPYSSVLLARLFLCSAAFLFRYLRFR
jgi:hypothetical protein